MRLPKNWTKTTLPELIGTNGILSDGDWVESKDQDPNGDVRLTQLADVGDGVFRDRSSRFMTSGKAAKLGCTYLQKDDVLVARMPDPLGRACLFPGSPIPCVTVVDVCIVRPETGDISNRWLMHTINSPGFRLLVSRLQSGSTRKRISKKNLCTIELPVPPANEQHHIVEAVESYLTRLDDAVASLERAQQNLKRYRASILKAAVEGRLVPTEAELAKKEGRNYEPASELLKRILVERRKKWIENAAEKSRAKAEKKARKAGKPWTHADNVKTLEKERAKAATKYKEPVAPDTSDLPDLPEGWCWTSSDQLMRYVTSGSRDWSKYYSDGGALFVRTEDIKWNYLDLSSVAHVSLPETVEGKRSLLQPRDLLITITGANVGRCAVVPQQISEAYVSQSIALVRLVDSSLASYLHLFSQTNLQGAQTELERLAYGMGRPVLNLTNVRELNIPLPPLGELQRIVEEADSRLCQGESIRELVRGSGLRIDRLRQSILKWAFEGKLIPQDSEDEPASALLDRIKAECSASRRYR